MDKIEKLMWESYRAFCTQCNNWEVVTFMGGKHGGCSCSMDPRICSLNGLANKM